MKQAKSKSELMNISYPDYLKERKKRQKLVNGFMVSTSVVAAPPPPPPPPPTTTTTPSPPWVNLPREMTAMILQKLGSVEILFSARRVCTTWRNICKDPAMWRVIDIILDEDEDGDDDDEDEDVYVDERFKVKEVKKVKKGRRCAVDEDQLRKLCRQAVDLSQGELIDIEVECDSKVLDYIAQRSPKLRRLHLHGDCDDCEVVISDAVKKFPLLEEMQYIYYSIYNQTIKTIIDIGRSCPLLTSFSLNAHGAQGSRPDDESNRLAFAVSSSMPKLRHLQYFQGNMTNIGLTAILDGCTQLESLDLRHCFNLKLDGKLGQRCSKQIKHLKLPKDCVKDYPKFCRYDDIYEDESESEEEEEVEDKYKEEGKEDDNSFLPYANYDEYFAAEKNRLEEEDNIWSEEDDIWSEEEENDIIWSD